MKINQNKQNKLQTCALPAMQTDICSVVQDLLPLYTENACSENSKVLINAHLAECAVCRNYLETLHTSTPDTNSATDTKTAKKETNKKMYGAVKEVLQKTEKIAKILATVLYGLCALYLIYFEFAPLEYPHFRTENLRTITLLLLFEFLIPIGLLVFCFMKSKRTVKHSFGIITSILILIYCAPLTLLGSLGSGQYLSSRTTDLANYKEIIAGTQGAFTLLPAEIPEDVTDITFFYEKLHTWSEHYEIRLSYRYTDRETYDAYINMIQTSPQIRNKRDNAKEGELHFALTQGIHDAVLYHDDDAMTVNYHIWKE